MNRKWILPLIVAVAAGLAAYVLTRNAACGRPHIPLDRLDDISFLTRELGLSAEQTAGIQRLNTSFRRTLDDCCARHCAARARLGTALVEDTRGDEAANTVVKEMTEVYAQSERATLDHIRAVRALLTTEQRTRFDTLITRCMCRSCGLHE